MGTAGRVGETGGEEDQREKETETLAENGGNVRKEEAEPKRESENMDFVTQARNTVNAIQSSLTLTIPGSNNKASFVPERALKPNYHESVKSCIYIFEIIIII